MKTKTKKATESIHDELVRVGNREIEVEVAEWTGDNDGAIRQTVKVQVWNLANRKQYAIWLPLDALPEFAGMIDRAISKTSGRGVFREKVTRVRET